MAQYRPKRLNIALPRPAGQKPRRLRRGAVEPRRLVSTPRHPPVVRLLLMAAALTTAAMLGGTTARYLKNWSGNAPVTAGNFYFTSDKLKEQSGAVYCLTPSNTGVAEFSFTLQNYIVAGYPTKSNISYTCSVKDSGGKAITAQWSNGDTPLTDGTGTLTGGSEQAQTITCSIQAAEFAPDQGLTVSVDSTMPYAKSLTANVTLEAENSGVLMEVTDPGGKWGAVTVTLYNVSTSDYEGTLTRWPQENLELALDPTWEIKPENHTVSIPSGGVVSMTFLKRDTTQSFSESDFTFTFTAVK